MDANLIKTMDKTSTSRTPDSGEKSDKPESHDSSSKTKEKTSSSSSSSSHKSSSGSSGSSKKPSAQGDGKQPDSGQPGISFLSTITLPAPIKTIPRFSTMTRKMSIFAKTSDMKIKAVTAVQPSGPPEMSLKCPAGPLEKVERNLFDSFKEGNYVEAHISPPPCSPIGSA